MIPLWLMWLPAAVDRLWPSRAGRVFLVAALAVSTMSVAHALINPWSTSWLHQFFRAVGWVTY
jgi:hypothetical protein